MGGKSRWEIRTGKHDAEARAAEKRYLTPFLLKVPDTFSPHLFSTPFLPPFLPHSNANPSIEGQMISPGRVIAIFQRKGGNGQITKTFDAFPEPQKALLLGRLKQDVPLIASFFSNDQWFAVTQSQVVLSLQGHIKSVPLEELHALRYPARAKQLAEGKHANARFELALRDGSVLAFEAEAGRPFVGLLNVFMYVIKMNHRY